MPKAKITKLFTGRGKTRPIPRVVDTSDRLAAKINGAETNPRTSATKAALGPRVKGTANVLGRPVGGGGRANGGVYNPTGVQDNI